MDAFFRFFLAQYIGPVCFNFQQFSKNSSHNFSHFARKLYTRRKLHAHPWYTIFTGEGVTPYNTKIRFGIVSRGENTKEIGNIASTRFLRKREPRVLSERGIVQRARDNRGRPFRKFDGMRSPSAKRRHPGETFYVWVVIYLLDRNTIAFHLEILVQYPRYNFVGRIFGREREREREYKGPLLYFTALRDVRHERCREIVRGGETRLQSSRNRWSRMIFLTSNDINYKSRSTIGKENGNHDRSPVRYHASNSFVKILASGEWKQIEIS